MRPDMEDYEELTPDAEAPRSRAMSWLVLGVAVGGFAALAYYAYHSGTQGQNGDMLIVQADQSPIKQAPTDAGGEDFANKDKTIYDVITPNGTPAAKTEKLLPDPEKPLAVAHDVRDNEESGDDAPEAANSAPAPVAAAPAPTVAAAPPAPTTTTFVNKNLTAAAPASDAVDAAASKQAAASTSPATASAAAAASAPKKTESTSPAAAAVTPATATETKSTGGPTFVNESTVATSKTASTTKAAPAKKPAKPVPAKPAAKAPASSGAYAVQLGAYKSEDEAKAAWKKIAAKFSGTISGSPTIVKADLPNGTFYRLRASGFASSDAAKAACAKLSAAKQACFPVGK